MKRRPLEFGRELSIRTVLDSREHYRFFNGERYTEAKKAEAMKQLERDLSQCNGCPHAKIHVGCSMDHSIKSEVIYGSARCEATIKRRSSCPAKFAEAGYLSTPTSEMPDWVVDAEKDAEKFKFVSPRGHGKSATAIFRDEVLFKESRSEGSGELTKEAKDEFERELQEIVDEVNFEQDLDEVVEFETNRSKYDNFGSW